MVIARRLRLPIVNLAKGFGDLIVEVVDDVAADGRDSLGSVHVDVH